MVVLNNNSKRKRFGVVIVTYNRLSLLKECIECVMCQTRPFDYVMIVNNCSTDGTSEYLNNYKSFKYLLDFNVYNTKNNLGGAGGFRIGVEQIYSKVDYVLLIDDDAMLDKEFLNNIERNMDDSIFAYSGTVETNNVIDTSHRRKVKNSILMTKDDISIEEYKKTYFDYDMATFCGLMVSSKIIQMIGFPKSEYFIWYDDTEYSLRIRKYSKIRNINSSKINHKAISSFSTELSWKSYYGYRNAIDMGRMYSKLPIVYLVYRWSFHIVRFLIYSVKSLLQRDTQKKKYLQTCAIMNIDVLKDSIIGKLGKSDKYFSGFKF